MDRGENESAVFSPKEVSEESIQSRLIAPCVLKGSELERMGCGELEDGVRRSHVYDNSFVICTLK
jgi:hypothetical protein